MFMVSSWNAIGRRGCQSQLLAVRVIFFRHEVSMRGQMFSKLDNSFKIKKINKQNTKLALSVLDI